MGNTNKNSNASMELLVKMAHMAWQSQNTRVDKLLQEITDEQWMADVVPGPNSGPYLFGHLIAVNDNLLPLFGLGQKLYPQLTKIFLTDPDKTAAEYPSMGELRNMWRQVNDTLTRHFNGMSPDDWLARHNSVSPEDFAREPHRNKLNVLLNRTTHQGYHIGQLVFLKR